MTSIDKFEIAEDLKDLALLWAPKATHIIQFETAAAVLAIIRCSQVIKNGFVQLFIDNKSALGAIRKGRSTDPDVHKMVQILHDRLALLGTKLRVRFVRSKWNIADAPSRGSSSGLPRRSAAQSVCFLKDAIASVV